MYERLQEAIEWSTKRHRGQFRDGERALPYVTHPIEVVIALRTVGGETDEDLLVVAALHDVLEETDATPKAIRKRFGERVEALVVELTRWEPNDAEREGRTDEEIYALRNATLLEEIQAFSVDAMRVKLADRFCNMRESNRTRVGLKLSRYVTQTEAILKLIPRHVNPALWDAVEAERARGSEILAVTQL